MIDKYLQILVRLAQRMHFNDYFTKVFSEGIAFISVLVVGILLLYLAQFIIKRTIYKVIRKSETRYDDELINTKMLLRLCLLIPSVMVKHYGPLTLVDFPNVCQTMIGISVVYDIIVITAILFSLVNVGNNIYDLMHEGTQRKSIAGVAQTIKIVLIIVCVLLVISYLMGKSLSTVVIGLGTVSAVLLLVFQNFILGFVGSIQLTAFDMLRIGDWISMGKADGTVTEINLTTVKVQNFDNTITTIPTSSMVTEQFTNWRGMTDSEGRRIMRSINIDIHSVKFCTPEMLERFRQIERVRDYIDQKEEEIAEYNKANGIDTSNVINGRQQTNLGIFRAYVQSYLNSNPYINHDMLKMVRQLQSNEFGIPLQVYVFSKDKNWARYEQIQSDIFDHIFAAAPLFDLKIYQKH